MPSFGGISVPTIGTTELLSDGWSRSRGYGDFLVDFHPAGDYFRAWGPWKMNWAMIGQFRKSDVSGDLLAFLQERWAAIVAEYERQARELAEAERRADELARDVLTVEEYGQGVTHGGVAVKSGLFPGWWYLIFRHGGVSLVLPAQPETLWQEWTATIHICINPMVPLCGVDRMVALVLLAKHNEDRLRATGVGRWPA